MVLPPLYFKVFPSGVWVRFPRAHPHTRSKSSVTNRSFLPKPHLFT